MSKIKAKEAYNRNIKIKPTEVSENRLSFNLFNLREHGDFCYLDKDKNCLESIMKRLQSISEFSRKKLDTDIRLKHTLHYHKINFSDGSISERTFGLRIPGADDNAYQFSITVNTGRIHGFWEGDVFHIVWIDPDHILYN